MTKPTQFEPWLVPSELRFDDPDEEKWRVFGQVMAAEVELRRMAELNSLAWIPHRPELVH